MLAEWNGLCCKGQLDLNPCSISFLGGSEGKESAYNEGDPGLIMGREDPLEKEMATHSSILVWRIPRTEEPGGLQSIESQRVGCNLACMHTILVYFNINYFIRVIILL